MDLASEFKKTAGGYATEQATRPSTIGLVIASNPLALLAWYFSFRSFFFFFEKGKIS
jgi:hypothetical protein